MGNDGLIHFSYDGSNRRFVQFGELWRSLGINSVDFSALTHTSSPREARKRKCLDASMESPVDKRPRIVARDVAVKLPFNCPFCDAWFYPSERCVFRRSICHVVKMINFISDILSDHNAKMWKGKGSLSKRVRKTK